MTPVERAVRCALAAQVIEIGSFIVTTDEPSYSDVIGITVLQRPPALAQDDTPMIAVVQHVLEQIPGPPDQKIVLLEPTQPLRTSAHITQALALLTPDVDSVVSVVELPRTHHPEWQLVIGGGWLYHSDNDGESSRRPGDMSISWRARATRRQDLAPTYIRDGTVYAFHRSTVDRHGHIYGAAVKPLIIPPEETCPLDTPQDWIEAERRLKERA